MKRLLTIEWLKIFHYRTAWIFIVLYFVLLVLMGFVIPQFKPEMNGNKIDFQKFGAYNFPVIWQNITYFAAIGKVFLAVIIITNITNEYSNRTLKQNLIDGLSKKEFLISKLLTVGILTILSTVVVFGITLFLGSQNSTVTPDSMFSGIEYMGVYALKLAFVLSFVMLLSFLFQKSSFAILMFVVWPIIESILGGIEHYFRQNMLMQNIREVTLWTDFLPLKTSAALIELPTVNIELILQNQPIFEMKPLNETAIVLTFVYLAITIYLSYFLLKKRDL